jgi:prepilin-type N-terminal cleavage/methylation domain-containing protein
VSTTDVRGSRFSIFSFLVSTFKSLLFRISPVSSIRPLNPQPPRSRSLSESTLNPSRPRSPFSTSSFLISTLQRHRSRAFTLLELLVVIGIISILLVAIIPAVTSLSKSSSGKAAVSNLMNALEQARALALTSGSATYVVFADQTTPDNYRCKAFIVFQEDKNFLPVAVTKWHFLPTGVSFQPSAGLLTAQSATPKIKFSCPGTMGTTPIELPFIKFDSTGVVAAPTDPAVLFANIFAGSVDSSGRPAFTDQTQKTTGKLDQVTVARFTGRARYVDPYS